MTKEEYLKKLEVLLQENNVEDSDAVLRKCERRFELAKEAGMNLDETIEMLGSPEEVVSRTTKVHENEETKTDRKVYNLEVRGCVTEDIIVKRNDSDKIVINIDEELQPYTKINQSENNISIVINHPGKMSYMDSDIEILVGNNIAFDKLVLASVSGDIELDGELEIKRLSLSNVSGDISVDKASGDTFTMQCVSGDINIDQITADTVNTSAVSGDISFGLLKAKECKVSTTSGDASAKYIECDYAVLNTFSGDINLTGKIKEKKARSFSGEINYCEIK